MSNTNADSESKKLESEESPEKIQNKELEDFLEGITGEKGQMDGSAGVSAKSPNDCDEELDELLDDALEDFNKPLPRATKAQGKEGKKAAVQPASGIEGADSEWTEEFIKQATSQFEQNMRSLLAQGAGFADGPKPEELGADFQKIAEAAAKAVVEESEDGDISATIAQTLKNLSDNAQGLGNPFSEDEMMSMFNNLGLGNDPAADSEFLPFMQQMMQSLLSKEILLPALKDIVEKYPAWLEENRKNIQEDEHNRYVRQHELMKQVCTELEAEGDTDTEEEKKHRFNKILDLMQKMQDCGQPPKELVGEMGPMMNFDEHGNPQIPGMPSDLSQCALM